MILSPVIVKPSIAFPSINLALTFLNTYPSTSDGLTVSVYWLFTLPSFNGESVTKATYWEIPSAGSPESSSGTVVFTVTVYLPGVVALPEIVPLFRSIVSPSGRPSAE